MCHGKGRILILIVLILITSLFLAVPGWLRGSPPALDPARSRRIVFVGNSLTFTHDIPGLLRQLSHRGSGMQVDAVDLSQPGWPLLWHLERGTVTKLKEERWDAIVIQEQSGQSLNQPDEARSSIKTLAQIAKEQGIPGYLYEISVGWWSPAQRAAVRELMRSAATENGLMLVPVASTWEALEASGLPSPYGPGNHHPSLFGSYSAAAVFLKILRSTALDPLPCVVSGRPELILDLFSPRSAVELTPAQCASFQNVMSSGLPLLNGEQLNIKN